MAGRYARSFAVEELERRRFFSGTLSAAILKRSFPVSAVSGSRTTAKLTLGVTNSGNSILKGKSSFTVYFSTDGAIADGTTVTTQSQSLTIKPGLQKVVTIPLKLLPTLPSATYAVLVQVIDPTGIASVALKPTPIILETPFASLEPTIVGPIVALNGKSIAISIVNAGNIVSSGPTTVTVYGSSSETANPAAVLRSDVSSSASDEVRGVSGTSASRATALATASLNLSIKPGETKSIRLNVSDSAAQSARQSDSFSVGVAQQSGSSTYGDSTLMTFISAFEGNRQFAYDDGKGNITIGIGSNISLANNGRQKIATVFGADVNYDWLVSAKDSSGAPYGLTKAQVQQLYDYDVNNAYQVAKKQVPALDTLSIPQQDAIIDVAFTVSPKYFNTQGAQFIKDVKADDWYDAGHDLTQLPRYTLLPGLTVRSDAEIAYLQDARYTGSFAVGTSTSGFDDGNFTTSGGSDGTVTYDIEIAGIFNTQSRIVTNSAAGTAAYSLSASYTDVRDVPSDDPSVQNVFQRNYTANRVFNLSGPPSDVTGSTAGAGAVIDYISFQLLGKVSGSISAIEPQGIFGYGTFG